MYEIGTCETSDEEMRGKGMGEATTINPNCWDTNGHSKPDAQKPHGLPHGDTSDDT